MARFQPWAPSSSPFDWGDESYVESLLGAAFELAFERRVSTLRLPSAEAYWELFSPATDRRRHSPIRSATGARSCTRPGSTRPTPTDRTAPSRTSASTCSCRERAEGAFPGRNGRIVFVSDRDGNDEIYSMNPNGSGVRRLTNDAASEGLGDPDIYVFRSLLEQPVLLTPDVTPAIDTRPAFSPDGETIAFMSTRSGPAAIFTMDADDGSGPRLLTNNDDDDPNWAPDGVRIVFTSQRPSPAGGNPSILTMVNSAEQRRLTNRLGQPPTSDRGPSFSPDGTKIAFARSSEIYTMRADGSGVTRLTNNSASDRDPDWAPAPGTGGCTIVGNNAANELNGTAGDDVICGLGGNDILPGLAGDDEVRGGSGDDRVFGGEGRDLVFGGDGDDVVHTIDGIGSNDVADGGPRLSDTCRTDPGDSVLRCP
ncbi:MAG: hypothetical protein ACRDNG_08410 [Gaiellaceae bacterium]